MDTFAPIDTLIATLIKTWFEKYAWNKALYDLSCSFLSSVFTDSISNEWPAFNQDSKTYDIISTESIDTSINQPVCLIASDQKTDIRKKCIDLLNLIPSYSGNLTGLDRLIECYNLTKPESRIVSIIYAYLNFGPLEYYMDDLPQWDALRRLADWAGIDSSALLMIINNNGSLFEKGIGAINVHAIKLSNYSVHFSLNDTVRSFLNDYGTKDLVSYLLDINLGVSLRLDDFDLPEQAKQTALAVMKAPPQVSRLLLYGKPGTGKTEFAKSICDRLGFQACFLRQKDDSNIAVFQRLILAHKTLNPAKDVIIIDEADDLLNIENGIFQQKDNLRKSQFNEFLDDCSVRMIFITNQTYRIPDSILRRLTYHLAFEDFTYKQRLRIWKNLCNESVFSNNDISNLASRYKANPSRIHQVIEVCNSTKNDKNMLDSHEIAKELLSRSNKLMYQKSIKEDQPNSWYDPSSLEISTPLDDLMSRLSQWKLSFDGTKKGINLLFYGTPGTGKTALAAWIAESLGLLPVIKKASDLLDMFVGGTEENIRNAFREAEGCILIIDEADSFLSNRSFSQRSWEKTMTNEILTHMEGFRGMFIATTNLDSTLDPACMRRFAFKIEFQPLNSQSTLRLLKKRFFELNWSTITNRQIERLQGLTPGDINAVAERLEYSKDISIDIIITALEEERAFRTPKNRAIGFTY